MPPPAGFQKAKLEIEDSDVLSCWFNPTQYSIGKANTWTTQPAVGSSLPAAQFGGGRARQLSVDLLFDAGPDGDVTGATDRLFRMMEVDPSISHSTPSQARPPTLRLSWGTFRSFKAVCEDLNVQFTLFRPDGTPTRATATLRLMQVEKDPRSGRGTPPPPQNPTTRSDDRLHTHVVRDGDSLQSIAFTYYGDPTRWPRIAEENDIDDPVRLPRGTPIAIPLEPA
jgi:hypothetical protein